MQMRPPIPRFSFSENSTDTLSMANPSISLREGSTRHRRSIIPSSMTSSSLHNTNNEGSTRQRRSIHVRTFSFDDEHHEEATPTTTTTTTTTTSPIRRTRSYASSRRRVLPGNSTDPVTDIIFHRRNVLQQQRRRTTRIQICLGLYVLTVTFYILKLAQTKHHHQTRPTWNNLLQIQLLDMVSLWPRYDNLYPPLFPRKYIVQLSAEVVTMCSNTLWHTIESTTVVLPHGDTVIFTGTLRHMGVRDASAQVHPLLLATSHPNLIAHDPKLDRIVSGVIKRCAFYIRHGMCIYVSCSKGGDRRHSGHSNTHVALISTFTNPRSLRQCFSDR